MSALWTFDDIDALTVLATKPAPDPTAATAVVAELFPESVAVPGGLTALSDAVTDQQTVFIGCFPGVTVVSSAELVVAHPGRLSTPWIRPNSFFVGWDAGKSWGAFAIWEQGTLRRSFSATNVTILEDEGLPQVWEGPYWSGEHPITHEPGVVPDPQSLPFDPRRLADEARSRVLGDVAGIRLCRFDLYDPDDAPHPQPEADPAPLPPPPVAIAPPKRRWFRRRRR